MKKYILENEYIRITADEYGAELTSLVNKNNRNEYLWNADERYWKRHAPVLFPLVGSLKNKQYRYEGIQYPMAQHGFARDKKFTVKNHTGNTVVFSLVADEETKKVYPFDFVLEIKYEIIKNTIDVSWTVKNQGDGDMYFAIGAHPAFMCPLENQGTQESYFVEFPSKDKLVYHHINEQGLYLKAENELKTENGLYPINAHMFDKDALIFENNQVQQVSLVRPDKSKYVTVTFDAPVFGLWSPAGKKAPFICIEPWFGRCDSDTFCGTIEEREWENQLKSGKVFSHKYSICIC